MGFLKEKGLTVMEIHNSNCLDKSIRVRAVWSSWQVAARSPQPAARSQLVCEKMNDH